MNIIFLFVDGVGLGAEDRQNPFTQTRYTAFEKMAGGQPFTKNVKQIKKRNHFFAPVDANLDIDGLPQSGTGQTALFTGENAAKVIGKHFGPWPHSGIKYLLKEESVFNKVRGLGKKAHFINAYPPIFFDHAKKTNRWSATTLMTLGAGLKLNGEEQVNSEEAITAGIEQQVWRERLNIDVPVISPQNAAHRLLKQSQKYDLLLHEYYLTDKAGHTKNPETAQKYLKLYNDFLAAIIREKPEDTTLVLSSDHGNVEDLSTKSHTRNKVPLFVCGPGATAFFEAKSILDVTPCIVEILS